MRLDDHIWRGLVLLCLSLQANAGDPNAAFIDAKAYAQGTVDGTGGIVSAEKAATMPYYSTNSPEPSLVPGSVGLGGAGIGKIQGCVGKTDNECAAVNFLAKNPDSRLRFNITPSDPSVLAGKHAIDNAGAVYRSLGDGREGTESACTTKTTTTPAQYTTETCTSLRAIEGQQCTMGRQVNIDADANYQCDKTLTAFTSANRLPTVSTSSCAYGRQVNIDADSNFQCDKTLTAFTSANRLPTVTTSSCAYGRQVNIDEDSRFQCDQTVSAYETLKCKRSSSVTCVGSGDGCDAGGIVANSWAGDMAVNWAPTGSGDYNLTFGTIADNYWGNGTYDRTLTFKVKDKSLITKFALTRAAFDDWLWVKVNDNTVYVGPYGGDRLYVIGHGNPIGGNSFCYLDDWSGQWRCYQYDGWSETPTQVGSYAYCSCVGWDSCTWYCTNDGPPGFVKYGAAANQYGSQELSTSWNIALNIDIKPYLKEGLNTVWMRTIVAGGGEGAVIFTTRQVCPVNCSISTNNQCAALEARSQ